MSSKLDAPVLTVDVAMIRCVDTQSVEGLHSIWTVFSRCAASLQEGKRLENLSWRIWNRETFCCEGMVPVKTPVISNPTSSPNGTAVPGKTPLSSGLPLRRGREKHITSEELQRMVIKIKERKKLEPFLPSHHTLEPSDVNSSRGVGKFLPLPFATTTKAETTRPSTVYDSEPKSQTYGFSPVPSSIPIADISAAAPSQSNEELKKKPVFALGGSSGDDSCELVLTPGSSLAPPSKKKSAMFSFGGSSNEDESTIMRSTGDTSSTVPRAKIQTDFRDEVARRTINEEAIDDDVFETDEDEIDESAIDDDDDSSEWEDSVEGSGNASADEKNLFQRVDSRVNLTSRRSLITTMLHQHDRMDALAVAATNSKSESSLRPVPVSNSRGPVLKAPNDQLAHTLKQNLGSISEIPRSVAQPISRPGSHSQNLALSPRTTRRNMLASELTVSLRHHLLWERKQKSQTVNAVLTRRHTSQDVEHLKQYPETSCKGVDDVKGSWDEYFPGGLGEYNSRGW
ncbi:hypothetical protein K3495_g1152 [Podosphaera aphanis]|nr:hypothetical protein K3495_g1152 [Podosphaera aphanis]